MPEVVASRERARGGVGDERLRRVSAWRRLLSRPELGAAAGTVLVFVFFAVVAGDCGLFSAKGIVNFLEVSAQLGILAAAVALLMIAGEFDLSVGSMIGFAGILIAIPPIMWGWPSGLASCWPSRSAAVRLLQRPDGGANRVCRPSSSRWAALFMLRGLTLGVTRGITGRTQVSGLHELFRQDWLRRSFAGQVFQAPVQLAVGHGLDQRADRWPAVQRHSGLDRLVDRAYPVLHLDPDCARASATGSSPPAAMPMRRATSACRWRAPRSRFSCSRPCCHAVCRHPGAGAGSADTLRGTRRNSKRSSPW